VAPGTEVLAVTGGGRGATTSGRSRLTPWHLGHLLVVTTDPPGAPPWDDLDARARARRTYVVATDDPEGLLAAVTTGAAAAQLGPPPPSS
jgi:hypothetical protein